MAKKIRGSVRQGDLVVVRFDNSLRVGIVTGRRGGGRLSFVYAERARPHEKSREGRLFTSALPRTRFLRARAIGGVGNLCDLTPGTVWPADDADRAKLEKWCQRFPCHHEGVHGAVIAVVDGVMSQDLGQVEAGRYRGRLPSCEAR